MNIYVWFLKTLNMYLVASHSKSLLLICFHDYCFLQVLLKIDELLDMLIAEPELNIGEHITEELESLEKTPYNVRGCVLTIVDRMDEEFIKLLKVWYFWKIVLLIFL